MRPNVVHFSILAAAAFTTGCGVSPPRSPLPDASSAIARMRASSSCGLGVQAAAKIDHFGKQGRVRGDLLLYAIAPQRLRMDAVSPFGVAIATLTTDGKDFALADLRDKRFYVGPATACNISRLTTVPIPGYVLVGLLRGEPPVLVHDPSAMNVSWHGGNGGYYDVTIHGTRDAEEELHMTPAPADFDKPWEQQHMRLTDVVVRQYGRTLYHAELDGHAPAPMSKPRVDPDGIDPPIQPSGPVCEAEIPRSIHLEVPDTGDDVIFRYDTVTWNPPLPEGVFTQPPPAAMPITPVQCSDE